jgi:tetratricopeptide (TPR) repeat protein
MCNDISMKKFSIVFLLLILLLVLSGCSSIEKAGINMISDVMAGEGSSELFTGDDDPELVKDALPFILKMYEMLVSKNPEDIDLLLATGSTFIMYSNIFIQTPAEMLPDEMFMEQVFMLNRSKKMYQRGTEYILDALDLKHDNFKTNLEEGLIDQILEDLDEEDVPYLYWAASGLMGEFSTDPFDFSLGPNIYKPVSFIYRALELDESYNNGAIHDLLILINSSLPGPMMFKASDEGKSYTALYTGQYYEALNAETAFDKARYHFEKSVEVSGGTSAAPYISLASTVSVNEQDYEEFEKLLNTALEIDPDLFPEMRLAGIIYRDKAQWLLDHKSDYFLLDFDEGDYDEIF